MPTPTSEFALARIDTIRAHLTSLLNPMTSDTAIYEVAKRLHTDLLRIWLEEERERGHALSDRILTGKCAIFGDWCLTHHVEENIGHALMHDRAGTD